YFITFLQLNALCQAKKSILHINATRPPIQVHPPVNRVPQGFFDGVSSSHLSAQSHTHSSALSSSTLLERLFHRSHDTSPSSPLDWARNFLTRHGQSGEGTELQGRGSAVVEVPYAKGKRRNACAREKRKRLLPLKNPASGSSQPPKPDVAKPPLQAQAADPSSSTTPAIADATITTGWTLDSLLAPHLHQENPPKAN
ncbi:hypothetical protein CY34DRAFT_19953, partial [Suillus luteus UH-Slu-Lm8-n1]